jgi:hypothetical protein
LGRWILASRLQDLIEDGVPHDGDRDIDMVLQPWQKELTLVVEGKMVSSILNANPKIRRLAPRPESWMQLLSDIDLARIKDWCEK